MPAQEWFRRAYRFVRSDGDMRWEEGMRPFKCAALAAMGCRDGRGRNRLGCADELDGMRKQIDDFMFNRAVERDGWTV